MKILHYAIENYARIPANLVFAEKQSGHESYLVVPYKPPVYFNDEDYCLDLPFVGKSYFNSLKKFIGYTRISASNKRKQINSDNSWKPGNPIISALFDLRDNIWENKIRSFLEKIKIESFDVLFLDGGAGFLRNGKIIKEIKKTGVRIIITYCGSDFRSRGPIPIVEEIADYRLTFEHDHKLMDAHLDFYFAPFRMPVFKPLQENWHEKVIRIGHAPTNRLAKGTDKILSILNQLKEKHPIEIVLIENLNHQQALALKASCHIFIDNLGEIGYGINSLESLSMGIPTAVQLMPDLETVLQDHPFINITEQTMYEKLKQLIDSVDLRKQYAEKGKEWVKKTHDAQAVSQKILKRIQTIN
jgi:hypothetical protein